MVLLLFYKREKNKTNMLLLVEDLLEVILHYEYDPNEKQKIEHVIVNYDEGGSWTRVGLVGIEE